MKEFLNDIRWGVYEKTMFLLHWLFIGKKIKNDIRRSTDIDRKKIK